jgi:hypothetical protein
MSNLPLGSPAGGPHKIINLKVAKTLGVEVGQPLFVYELQARHNRG